MANEEIGQARSFLPRMGLVEIAVSGIWIRRTGSYIELLAENPATRNWQIIATEYLDSQFSHIVEPAGIKHHFDNDNKTEARVTMPGPADDTP